MVTQSLLPLTWAPTCYRGRARLWVLAGLAWNIGARVPSAGMRAVISNTEFNYFSNYWSIQIFNLLVNRLWWFIFFLKQKAFQWRLRCIDIMWWLVFLKLITSSVLLFIGAFYLFISFWADLIGVAVVLFSKNQTFKNSLLTYAIIFFFYLYWGSFSLLYLISRVQCSRNLFSFLKESVFKLYFQCF